MSYIINNTNPFVSIKLTEIGRQQLSLGQLTFSYWGIGDSEINYDREDIVDINPSNPALTATTRILKPFDQQPNLKYFITKDTINQYIPLDNGSKHVIKAVVNNKAEQRGFFSYSGTGDYKTFTETSYTPYTEAINYSKINGTNTLQITDTSNINVGDFMLLKLANDMTGNITLDETTRAIPNLWFKIKTKTSSSVTLDRNLPNCSTEDNDSQILIYKNGEVYDTIGSSYTTAYWDSGTLAFQSNNNVTCHDIPVWNMNNVWRENPAGIVDFDTYEDFTKFGSYPYLGFLNPYVGYPSEVSANTVTTYCNSVGTSYLDEIKKSISIIHFTNNSISNLYGEFLYIDATKNKIVEVYIPELMYHRRDFKTGNGTTMGMNFIASGSTQLIKNTDIQYIDLMEDYSMISSGLTAISVGKVFPQLKMIIFDNDEIVSALSYKSNRNWTLPELSATLTAPGGSSTGILGVNETMYLTYILENDNPINVLKTSIPCQTYVKITNNTSAPKDIDFRLIGTDLLPYMRKTELVGYDGLGFHAHKFKLVYQKVSDEITRPDSNLWKVSDFTSDAITSANGETIDPLLLENQTPFVNGFNLNETNDATATIFNLTSLISMAQNNSPDDLQFGDERFFYGNINTYIGATIYKTIFDITIDSSFNLTSNPTRSKDLSTSPATIRVSEVGIYDSNKNLVCIGKLSTPIPLITQQNTINLELSMDF